MKARNDNAMEIHSKLKAWKISKMCCTARIYRQDSSSECIIGIIRPIVTFAYETWTIRTLDQKRLMKRKSMGKKSTPENIWR